MKPAQLKVETIDYCVSRGIDPIRYAKWKAYIHLQVERYYRKRVSSAQ